MNLVVLACGTRRGALGDPPTSLPARRVVFPTVEFAIFFPIVLALSWALMPQPALWKPFILVASYVFYAAATCGSACCSPASRWATSSARRSIDRDERRPRARTGSSAATVALDLGVLGVFKYYAFFVAARRPTCSTRPGLGVRCRC